MKISIVILNYKHKILTKQCIKNTIDSIADLDYEIIVVDNNSNDGIKDFLAKDFPKVKLVSNDKNLGFGAGYNEGIKQSSGEYVLVLTADVTPMKGSIEKLYQFMKENPTVGLAAPKLLNPDGTTQISCRTFTKSIHILLLRTPLKKLSFAQKILDKHIMRDFDRQTNKAVDWVMGACMIVRREAMDKVGMFDKRFFFYVEDLDWCRRFWQAGWQVYYVADSQMVHLHEKASDHGIWKFWKIDKFARLHIKSWLKYIFKYSIFNKYGRK